MRLTNIALLSLAACAPKEPTPVVTSTCTYGSLAQVARQPTRANGKTLCAEVYSYSRHGFLAFYDRPIENTYQALNRPALLLGEEDAAKIFKGRYPADGQRVGIKGTVNLQLSCFVGPKNSCVPVRHPIYVNSSDLAVISK